MRFHLLGTGTLLPDPHRGPAGFLAEIPGARVLIDGGSGTLQRLARHGVDARDLDAGIYSHRHLDHCGDLAPLLFAMRVGIDRPRRRPYPIWAGQGFRAFLDGLEAVYGGWIRTPAFQADVHELPLDGPARADLPGGLRLDTRPAVHSGGALHLRLSAPGGATAVFSGDTGPSRELIELARGVDLLVCECASQGPDPWNSHLSAEDVADLLAQARPRRAVLTHFYPGVDVEAALARCRSTGVPVSRGEEGEIIELEAGAG